MIEKQKIERICRAAGMVPVERDTIEGAELFIADGLSIPPHRAYRRFGIGPEQFPRGMFVTLWWISKGDEKLDTGQPLFFEIFHDPQYSSTDKKRARINSAKAACRKFLQSRKRVRLNG